MHIDFAPIVSVLKFLKTLLFFHRKILLQVLFLEYRISWILCDQLFVRLRIVFDDRNALRFANANIYRILEKKRI